MSLDLGAEAWPEPMRSHLLGVQYEARRRARDAYPGSVSYIVQADGIDAGWIVVSEAPEQLRLVEIMVLPECRDKGIGSVAIAEALRIHQAKQKPVRLDVNPMNHGAIRLYERLGFRIVERDPVRFVMEKS